MKKLIIILITLVFIASLTAGCTIRNEASIREISISEIKNEQQKELINSWGERNGAYLIENSNRNEPSYLFLNSFNVEKGKKATYIASLKVDYNGEIMQIYYKEKETDQVENIKNKVIYKIPGNQMVDTIMIYKNGEETYFQAIGVTETVGLTQ